MPEDNHQSQPAQPQQRPADRPPKPAEPPNVVFKGGENPHEATRESAEKSRKKE